MTVLSAKALAKFADDFHLRPDEAVTFVRNADPVMRRAIADKYAAPAPTGPDPMELRQAMAAASGRPDPRPLDDMTACPSCRLKGWAVCEHASQHRRDAA